MVKMRGMTHDANKQMRCEPEDPAYLREPLGFSPTTLRNKSDYGMEQDPRAVKSNSKVIKDINELEARSKLSSPQKISDEDVPIYQRL
jgi:hypothetical protein